MCLSQKQCWPEVMFTYDITRPQWVTRIQNRNNSDIQEVEKVYAIQCFGILFLSRHRRPHSLYIYPDSKVHGANMGPTWVLSAPNRPHVGPMNLAIRVGCPFHLARFYRTDLFVQGPPAWPLTCRVWYRGDLIRLWFLTYTKLEEHLLTPPTYGILYGLLPWTRYSD